MVKRYNMVDIDESILTVIEYTNQDNTYERTIQDNEGNFHCLSEPARKCWYSNGAIKTEEWMVRNFLHNINCNCPAGKQWKNDGTLLSEIWANIGTPHRENGPAITLYHTGSNNIRKKSWKVNGDGHRIDGPAIELYNINGLLESMEFIINGENISNHVKRWMEKLNIPKNFTEWTEEHKFIFKISFS